MHTPAQYACPAPFQPKSNLIEPFNHNQYSAADQGIDSGVRQPYRVRRNQAAARTCQGMQQLHYKKCFLLQRSCSSSSTHVATLAASLHNPHCSFLAAAAAAAACYISTAVTLLLLALTWALLQLHITLLLLLLLLGLLLPLLLQHQQQLPQQLACYLNFKKATHSCRAAALEQPAQQQQRQIHSCLSA
jgi:hypothetical protein